MTLYVHLLLTGCKGTITFSGDTHGQSIIVSSEKLKANNREKRAVNARSGRLIYAKTEGNCCWQIHNKERNRGMSKTITTANTHEPGWEIRSVKWLWNEC